MDDSAGSNDAAVAFERMKAIINDNESIAEEDKSFANTWLEELLLSMDDLAETVNDLNHTNQHLESEVAALTSANQKLLTEKRRAQLSNLKLEREMSNSRDASHHSREASPITAHNPTATNLFNTSGHHHHHTRPVLNAGATPGLTTPPPSNRASLHLTSSVPPPPSPFTQGGGGATATIDTLKSLEMSGVYVGENQQTTGQLQYVSARHLPPSDGASSGGRVPPARRHIVGDGHEYMSPEMSGPSASPSPSRHNILRRSAAGRNGAGNSHAKVGGAWGGCDPFGLNEDQKLMAVASVAAVTSIVFTTILFKMR